MNRLGAMAMAAIVLLSCIPTSVMADEKTEIKAFENYSPHYAESVEMGTTVEELNLPATLRAVIELEDKSLGDSFHQEKPEAHTEDGYVSYDYFYYGYVAPENAEELYEIEEPVIYTVYYGTSDDETSQVTGVEYRMYGSVNEGDPAWFKCSAEGVLEAIVVDVPVEWDIEEMDISASGHYEIEGECPGYKYDETPLASILVTDSKEEADDTECETEEYIVSEPQIVEDNPVDEREKEKDPLSECECGEDGSALPGENFPWAHLEECPCYEPIQCMCRELISYESVSIDENGEEHREEVQIYGGYADEHDEDNINCPLYGKDTVEVINEQNGDLIIVSEEDAEFIQNIEEINDEVSSSEEEEDDELTSSEEKSTYDSDAELLAFSKYDGANSKNIYEFIEKNTPTKITDSDDNPNDGFYSTKGTAGILIPIAWKEYVHTIWMNKAFNQFDWEKNSGVEWKWSGVTATVSNSDSETNPRAVPKKEAFDYLVGGTKHGSAYVVYSGEQLLYALNALAATTGGDVRTKDYSQTIFVACDIDLNGMENNWRPVDFAKHRIEITGVGKNADNKWVEKDRTIYNLGSYAGGDDQGVGLINALSGSLVIENITFKNALLAYDTVTNKRNCCSLFGYSDTTEDVCRFEDVHVIDSMFYGDQQVSALGRREYASKVERCSTGNCFFFGSDHVTSLTTGVTPYRYYASSTYSIDENSEKYTIKKDQENVLEIVKNDKDKYIATKNTSEKLNIYYKENGYGIIENSYTVGSLLATTGGHSAGFASCYLKDIKIEDCFSSVEMYVTAYSGGFTGLFSGSVERCFSTGKLEGFSHLGGFCCSVANSSINNPASFTDCYSTVLTGMRSESKSMGGFAATDDVAQNNQTQKKNVQHMTFTNCYAAGEVGNISTDMSNPENVGGFLNLYSPDFDTLGVNLYYDKQTTAMREWQTGTHKGNLDQIQGVLTDNTKKSGSGLTNTNPQSASKGFKGFGTDNKNWDYSLKGHYPELKAMKNADASKWGGEEHASIAKAYSLASTSTVILDTWDKGYDWNDVGVRTKDEISYEREADDHQGGTLTYDTVRDIISPFEVTSTASYTNMVNKGAGANISIQDISDKATGNEGTKSSEQGAIVIDNAQHTGIAENPGMDWFRIEQQYRNAVGYRPIRLVGYMSIEAGEDKALASGELYDHRLDVRLTMMDTIVDNMVVGFKEHEDKEWSTSVKDGYPRKADGTSYEEKYYAVPTNRLVTETNKSTAEDAWIYTEIWRAEQDKNGNYVNGDATNGYLHVIDGNNVYLKPEVSVKVTGEGTESGQTLSQQKWNGKYPIYLDNTTSHKYIVSYYWMLTDGRYVTDYKIVTVQPGTNNLDMYVRSYVSGETYDPLNSNSLKIGAAMDNDTAVAYTISTETKDHAEVRSIPFGKNVAVGWQYDDENVKVKKIQIDYYAINQETGERQYMGTGSYDSADMLKELNAEKSVQIPVDVTYVYDVLEEENGPDGKAYFREVTYTKEKQKVVYDVTLEDDTLQLRFAKFQNQSKPDEQPLGIEDKSGLDGVDSNIYINDLMYYTDVTLWTERDLKFQKLDENGQNFGKDEAAFKLYELVCTNKSHNHSEDKAEADSQCWELFVTDNATDDAEYAGAVYTDEKGNICFKYVPSGQYRLVEVKTADGYMLPDGQWKVIVRGEEAGTENGFTFIPIGDNPAPAFSPATVNPGGSNGRMTVVHNYPTVKIKKVVAGNLGDRSQPFEFEVKIMYDDKQITVPEVTDEYTVDGSGTLHFDLKHGEILEIPYSIPVGAKLEITEKSGKYTAVYTQEVIAVDGEGNPSEVTEKLTASVKDGFLSEKTTSATAIVTENTPMITVTNTFDEAIDTGIRDNTSVFWTGLTFAAAGVVLVILSKKRKQFM